LQPVIVKLAALDHTDPTAFLLGSSATITLLLCLYLVASRQSMATIALQWQFYQGSALLGFVLPLLVRLLISYATPLYLLTISVALTPVAVALLSGIWLGERLSARSLCCLAAGVSGAALCMTPTLSEGSTVVTAKTLAVLLIPVLYAVNQLFVYRYYPVDRTAVQVAAGESVHAVLLTVPLMIVTLSSQPKMPIHHVLSYASIVWGIVTAVETVVYFWASRRATPNMISSAIYLSIGFSTFCGLIVFGEEISTLSLLGMLFIGLAAYGMADPGRRETEDELPIKGAAGM
jgi:drug/metabolite transporter (DMT)-like permease